MPILFISTHAGSWGACEELWTRTAALLAGQGVPVAASVHGWVEPVPRLIEMSRVGVDVRPRPAKPSLSTYMQRYRTGRPIMALDIERAFGNASPRLVVISDGGILPPIEVVEICLAKKWPFVTLSHVNSPDRWPTDEVAARWRKILPAAQRCLFVSDQNLTLAQRQLGFDFQNAEIVRNPLFVDVKLPFRWPEHPISQELRMACVARLHIAQKGQDILLDVLARPHWKERNWRLTFYGSGPNREGLERLVERLQLHGRVLFAGHVAIESVWRDNHVLIVPSRYEGVPMTTVEAMWCGRPVVATSVGANPELIKDGVTGFLAEAAAVDILANAVERMWAQRDRLEEIGKAAAAQIKEFMPNDPVGVFAERLKTLARFSRTSV